jgi:glutathione S-transferase
MAYTLYNAPQSTCSQRVRFVLNAKKLPFAEVKLNLLEGDQLKPDYLKLNPNAVVPTLDHDGAIVTDSTVIAEYLDEVEPAVSFTPEDPVKRARMRALMHFIDEMPAAAVRVPTFNLAFLPRFQAMSREDFVAMAESKPLRREFMLTMGQTGFPQAEMDAALGRLRRSYERMDAEIEKSGGPWLLGQEITLADVTAMPALVRMHDLRMADWQDLPRVVTWLDTIRAQAAFQPTYYHGSLLSERFPHLREKLAKTAYAASEAAGARRRPFASSKPCMPRNHCIATMTPFTGCNRPSVMPSTAGPHSSACTQ